MRWGTGDVCAIRHMQCLCFCINKVGLCAALAALPFTHRGVMGAGDGQAQSLGQGQCVRAPLL
eukprot:1158701-Pelagomonas_calceolata.AAC.7